MAVKLKLSVRATENMGVVQKRLNLGSRDKLWTLRIAAARSLQLQDRRDAQILATIDPAKSEVGKRFEIELPTFEQKDGLLFRSLLNQYYHERLSDEEYQRCLTYHIEHGLNKIFEETKNFSGYEYLVFIAQNGLGQARARTAESSEKNTESASEGSSNVLSIRIGVEKHSNEPYIINFNKTDEHANNYVGIMGKPGSGKTYFARYLLEKIREASEYKTNFIIFDYAKGDIASNKEFISRTRAKVIDVTQQPIPLNVFELDENTERARRFAAERIVEVLGSVEARIGKVQEQNLYQAIMQSYKRVESESYPYPDFEIVREELEKINVKPDSLTSVFRPLTELNLFANRQTPTWDSPTNQTAIIDIHRLPAMKDLCVFLVLKELYRQLMLMPDSYVDPETNAREMRTVIVLDEAHHFLSSKKRVQVLEKLIREIRSKGASVMLLSQSPDDYDKTDFNFLELLEFIFVLESNPSSPKFLSQAFGLRSEQAKQLMRSVTELKQGEAFSKKGNSVSEISLCR